jgi:hypothetical protein
MFLLDEAWYTQLGGGFGPVSEQFVKSASWVKWRVELVPIVRIKKKNRN